MNFVLRSALLRYNFKCRKNLTCYTEMVQWQSSCIAKFLLISGRMAIRHHEVAWACVWLCNAWGYRINFQNQVGNYACVYGKDPVAQTDTLFGCYVTSSTDTDPSIFLCDLFLIHLQMLWLYELLVYICSFATFSKCFVRFWLLRLSWKSIFFCIRKHDTPFTSSFPTIAVVFAFANEVCHVADHRA